MNSISEQENALFEEWEKILKNEEIVRDGVVDEVEFKKSKPKIVYFLKEVNGENDDCLSNNNKRKGRDLRVFLKGKGDWRTWNNVARWTYGIRGLYAGKTPEMLPWEEVPSIDDESRPKQLLSICAMNVKKTSGGSSAKRSEIRCFEKKYGCLLDRQINIYKPDIIICCGIDYYNDKYGEWKKTISTSNLPRPNLRKLNPVKYKILDKKRVIIDFIHPLARRAKTNYAYLSLINAIHEIRSKHSL